MTKTNKGGYQILDLSFVGNLNVDENYIPTELINLNDKSVFKDDNFRNLYNILSNKNNKKQFVITGLTVGNIEYRDVLVRNVEYNQDTIYPTTSPYITLKLYNGTSIIIGYAYPGYSAILIEITGGIE